MQDYSQSNATQPEDDYSGFEHSRYLEMWREWVDLYGQARKQHFIDEEYYDGDVKGDGSGHWTSTELKILSDRNQPPVVFNLTKRKINAIAGVEQRSRAEPRALPRTPKDQYAAEICTDALRYIKEQTRLSMTSANGFLEALKIGFTASEIQGAEDHVVETPIEWRDFFFDPRSRMWDFSDARYMGIAKWIDADVAKELYVPAAPPKPQFPPQPAGDDPALMQAWAQQAQALIAQYNQALKERQRIEEIIDNTMEGGVGGAIADGATDYDDHPSDEAHFGDRKRKRIFVIDMWHRDPKKGWFRCVFTGKDKLFTEEASLIEKDQWGRKVKTHPLKAFSLYVSKDGWRYGEVRGMRSPQDEVNARRSKALHLLLTKLLIYEPGAFIDGDVEKARKELARPDGVIATQDTRKILVMNNLELAAGQQRLGEEAREFLEMEGPNPQLQGEQGRATSGRAVLALQQAGLGQLGPIFDRFHDWEDRRYKAMWFRVQQFWRAEMYVRVTDDKNAAKFAAVNGAPVLDENGQPKRKQAMMMQPGGSDMPMHQMPNGQMMQGAYHGAPMQQGAGAPMLGHNGGPPVDPSEFETGPMLAELDMDIIIDRAPEAATLQAEQFEEMAKLAGTGLFNGLPPAEVARMMVTASSLPTKTQLLDMLDKIAQQPQGPSPQEKAMLEKLAAEIEKIISETRKNQAQTAAIGAEIPKTQAQARTENVEATMSEFGAARALDSFDALARLQGGSAPSDPLAAAAPPGALGLPPSQANGPPPF